MTFRAPVRDIAFALNVAGHGDLAKASFPDLDEATIEAVLDAAGAFATDVLAPRNRIGDQQGASHKDGKVTATHLGAMSKQRIAEWIKESA